jgi:hypothetical protein
LEDDAGQGSKSRILAMQSSKGRETTDAEWMKSTMSVDLRPNERSESRKTVEKKKERGADVGAQTYA